MTLPASLKKSTFWYVLLVLLAFALSFTRCNKDDGGTTGGSTTPTLSISQVSKVEGNGGNNPFGFELTLSAASTQAITVELTTTNGTAVATEDFVTVNKQVVTIAPGQTKATFNVQVVGDEWKEGSEDFNLQLSNPVNCKLASTATKGFITNDDEKIRVVDDGSNTSPLTYPGYTLAWQDEFNGSSLNLTDWNFEVGDGCPNNCGWGNNELEYYTAGDNLYLQEGKAIIEARPESRGGKNYTSTRMTTQNKKTFTFGRIDIRAKLPKGQGVWPALWMLGTNITTVSWPKCGEMDILELLGHEPNKVYQTVHYGPGPGSIQKSQSRVSPTSYSDGFHLYSLIWVQDKLQFLVDNVLLLEVNKADVGGNAYPFNSPFFFIFNIAVGGNWPGSPDASTQFPQWMMVDYIRVFQ